MAVASTAMPDVQTDESTLITAFVTAMVEAHDAKGSGWSTATRLDHFTDEAGVEAAQHAIDAIGGERVPSGDYTIVFGRQPVADLAEQPPGPRLHVGELLRVEHAVSGPAGPARRLAALTVYDDGAAPGLIGSQGHHLRRAADRTHRPHPRRRLRGCLSSWYETQRLLRDPALATSSARR